MNELREGNGKYGWLIDQVVRDIGTLCVLRIAQGQGEFFGMPYNRMAVWE